jgi:hypothetical protein
MLKATVYGDKIISLTYQPPLHPGDGPGTHLLQAGLIPGP